MKDPTVITDEVKNIAENVDEGLSNVQHSLLQKYIEGNLPFIDALHNTRTHIPNCLHGWNRPSFT